MVALRVTVIKNILSSMMSMDGPDHRTSLEPHELKAMVKPTRNIEKCLGNEIKRSTQDELEVIKKGIVRFPNKPIFHPSNDTSSKGK